MRTVLRATAAAVAFAGVGLSAHVAASIPKGDRMAFAVARGEDPMGSHTLRFERRGEELHVFVDIELTVDFGFITVYRYEHSNHETWRDGRLMAIETRTHDDGDDWVVSGRAVEAGFKVTANGETVTAPADIVPTSWWHPESMLRAQLLDSGKGRLFDVNAEPLGPERVGLTAGTVDACRWRTSGDLDADFWYDANGNWVKLTFDGQGKTISYTFEGGPDLLTGRPAAADGVDLAALGFPPPSPDVCPK